MLLAAIILSSIVCVLQLISVGLYLEKGNMSQATVTLIFAEVFAFITYTLLTFNN